MQYHVLFCPDGKSIQFQGENEEGIVDPFDVLKNGRVVKTVTREEIKTETQHFNYIDSVDITFIPD